MSPGLLLTFSCCAAPEEQLAGQRNSDLSSVADSRVLFPTGYGATVSGRWRSAQLHSLLSRVISIHQLRIPVSGISLLALARIVVEGADSLCEALRNLSLKC